MKKVMALLTAMLMIVGCSIKKDGQNDLLKLREGISGKQYAFLAIIHADFGENTNDFKLDCMFDTAGNMTFSIVAPDRISGITGKIHSSGGELTFDDKAVAFHLLADGNISPVCAPWLAMRGLRSGFISSWGSEDEGKVFTIDDTFEGLNINFRVLITRDLQVKSVEIYWEDRCILSIAVENFRYL